LSIAALVVDFLLVAPCVIEQDVQLLRAEWEAERRRRPTRSNRCARSIPTQRSADLQTYLASPEGRRQFAAYESTFLELYRRLEPNRFRDAAREAAADKIEREHFHFPEFGVPQQRPTDA
jgi:hypothetical protein